jgi:hypothetical protein
MDQALTSIPHQDLDTIETRVDEAAGQAEVFPGVVIWKATEFRGTSSTGHDFEARVELREGRLGIVEFRQRGADPLRPVDAVSLREVPVAHLVRHAFMPVRAANMSGSAAFDPHLGMGVTNAGELQRLAQDGSTDETLRMVAKLYTVAFVMREKPVQVVSKAFRIAPTTARSWVTRARAKGHLGPAGGPGRAGA